MVERLPALRPRLRSQAIRALFRRAEWTTALVDALEKSQVRLSELVLDQKQALAAHPNKTIAGRARRLLRQGGGLPDADRQRVIDQLTAQVQQGRRPPPPASWSSRSSAPSATATAAKAARSGPTSPASPRCPATSCLIHILDPSRSVEGNFVQYTVATTDGRVIGGLLAAETKTTVELLDAEGKRHVVLREDIDEMKASKKSLMPEGFEKQITAGAVERPAGVPHQPGQVPAARPPQGGHDRQHQGMFYDANSPIERLVFRDWSPKIFEGVPFLLVDPQGSRVPNVILLHGPNGEFPPRMPRSVELPCHAPAKAIHFLSGVSGWGYPGGQKGSVSMIVRLHYADGSVEDHPLENGVQFADYIRVRGRPRLEARLQPPRPAGPLPRRASQEEGRDRPDRAGQGPR